MLNSVDTRVMEIRVNVSDEVARSAAEKARAVGLTVEQAIATYLWRVAEGTEPLENELGPDGIPVRRTLRQQIYR
jgi:antitoxin component of RelBE/YafQ-DinJ toxin-antitoxin module